MCMCSILRPMGKICQCHLLVFLPFSLSAHIQWVMSQGYQLHHWHDNCGTQTINHWHANGESLKVVGMQIGWYLHQWYADGLKFPWLAYQMGPFAGQWCKVSPLACQLSHLVGFGPLAIRKLAKQVKKMASGAIGMPVRPLAYFTYWA